MSWADRANNIAARWAHGHDELTTGCALCEAEFAEVMQMTHGPKTSPDTPKEPRT